MFRIEVISANELDIGLEDAWRDFQCADIDLRSPFFAPEFCRIVADVREDVRIAVITAGGTTIGFFPFHRQRYGRIAPLAGQISDYHGIIGRRGAVANFGAVLTALKAQAFDFNHVPGSQIALRDHAYLNTDSPLVDLSDGFENWRIEKRATTKGIRELERKSRKLAREVGQLRFVANETDPAVWQTLLGWKRNALTAMGVKFVLDQPWARAVVEAVRQEDAPRFGGMTSALWAGDELAAASLSMRTDTTGHSWFTTYDPTYFRTSPGLLLLLELLRDVAHTGISEFDLGRGQEAYKREFANSARGLCEGSIERRLTPLGVARKLRKVAQLAADKSGSPKIADFTRRAGNRLLSAGRLA